MKRMTWNDAISTANLLAILFIPAASAAIGFLHKQNQARWQTVFKQLSRAQRDHSKLRKRIRRIETKWRVAFVDK